MVAEASKLLPPLGKWRAATLASASADVWPRVQAAPLPATSHDCTCVHSQDLSLLISGSKECHHERSKPGCQLAVMLLLHAAGSLLLSLASSNAHAPQPWSSPQLSHL
jgi:hypothetical protein